MFYRRLRPATKPYKNQNHGNTEALKDEFRNTEKRLNSFKNFLVKNLLISQCFCVSVVSFWQYESAKQGGRV